MLRLLRNVHVPASSGQIWRHLHVTSQCGLLTKSPVPERLVSSSTSKLHTLGLNQEVRAELDLGNTKDAYMSKTNRELLRAYLVFRMCSYETLLRNQKRLLSWARSLLGRNLFRRAMRMSVYGQFMAGEVEEEILQVAHRHHQHGVRPMFAYTTKESHGAAAGMVGSDLSEDTFTINYIAMQKCIEMSKLSPKLPNEFVKVTGKLTGLVPAGIFRTCTTLIDANTEMVTRAVKAHAQDKYWVKIREVLEDIVTSDNKGNLSQVGKETGLPIPSNFRSLDWRSLNTCLAFHVALSKSKKLADLLKEVPDADVTHYPLSADDEADLLMVWSRMDDLAERSCMSDVCLVVDAEQTYLQSAMDLMALDLMRKHNTKRPVVSNTYQCYLRRTYDVITRDLDSADAEGFYLGAKVVRGGYMDEERGLAAKGGYPDPVNATFADTTAMYYKVAEELLARHLAGTTLQVTFATHNEGTVKHILRLMHEKGVSLDPNVFSFAQLIGMRDHIAFILGRRQLPANKLLHYGDVEDCVAYLSRRLTENSSGVPTADVERAMIGTELKRRMRTGEIFRRKSVS